MASKEGLGLSMSPTVPPISVMMTSSIGLFANRCRHKLFDFVGDVGDDLNGLAEVVALAFLVQNVPVDLAGGEVGVAGLRFSSIKRS